MIERICAEALPPDLWARGRVGMVAYLSHTHAYESLSKSIQSLTSAGAFRRNPISTARSATRQSIDQEQQQGLVRDDAGAVGLLLFLCLSRRRRATGTDRKTSGVLQGTPSAQQ
jgi:hypothetical protein